MDKIKFSGRYNANMINKSWVNITSPHIMTTKILMIRFKKPIKITVPNLPATFVTVIFTFL